MVHENGSSLVRSGPAACRRAAAVALCCLAAWAATDASAENESGPSPADPRDNPFRIESTKDLQLPGESWAVRVALPGFDLQGKSTSVDEGGAMLSARHTETNVEVTLRLEQESEPLPSIRCRGKYFPRDRARTLRRRFTRRWDDGEFAMGEYVGEMKPGSAIPHIHVHGYMGKDDVCITLHVSKVPYEEDDRPLIEAVFDSVTIVDPAP